jgi:hypothetical protein
MSAPSARWRSRTTFAVAVENARHGSGFSPMTFSMRVANADELEPEIGSTATA